MMMLSSFKKQIFLVLFKLLQKVKKEGNVPDYFKMIASTHAKIEQGISKKSTD